MLIGTITVFGFGKVLKMKTILVSLFISATFIISINIFYGHKKSDFNGAQQFSIESANVPSPVQPQGANVSKTNSLSQEQIEFLRSRGKTDEEIADIANRKSGPSQATPTSWTQTAALAAAVLLPSILSILPKLFFIFLIYYLFKRFVDILMTDRDTKYSKKIDK